MTKLNTISLWASNSSIKSATVIVAVPFFVYVEAVISVVQPFSHIRYISRSRCNTYWVAHFCLFIRFRLISWTICYAISSSQYGCIVESLLLHEAVFEMYLKHNGIDSKAIFFFTNTATCLPNSRIYNAFYGFVYMCEWDSKLSKKINAG